VADELAVWMYGKNVATIVRERGRPRLAYTQEALDNFQLGTPLLSLSLPLTNRQYPQGTVRPFLDGLLPEGEARKSIARDVGVGETDTFGLIRELGRDCAGAIVIQPMDEAAPIRPTILTAEKLEPEELETLVRELKSAPLGVGGRVRISLAGVQEKLVLTRMLDGSWGRPVDGTPSTHILKPEIAAYPETVENEAFCMRVAKRLGLDVANVETTVVGARKLIVVERYDRIIDGGGSVERVHQEDFCQATGTAPDLKYEENGGPSLKRIASILEGVAIPGSLDTLLRSVTVNSMIGNGDAHAKNFSLLHNPDESLQLTPLYDLMSTLYYEDDRLAMRIDNVLRTNRVTADRIVNEAVSWGMPRTRATEIVNDVLSRGPGAVAAAKDDTPSLPQRIYDVVMRQIVAVGTAT
jgi:serine/threonine-protein kinase HipA